MSKEQDAARRREAASSQFREQETFDRWIGERPAVRDQANRERQQLNEQFTGLYNTGGLNPEAVSRGRSYIDEGLSHIPGYGNFGGGGGGGGYDFSQGLKGGAQDYFGDAYNAFLGLSKTGGISGVDLNAVREPLSYYRNFADTGGYSEAQKGDIRSRALSPLASLYEGEEQNLDRLRSVQGGYSPGYSGARAALARTRGTAMTDASRAAEMDIADRVRAGQQWGVQGIGSTQLNAEQLNLAQQEAAQRGMLGGAGGLTDIGGARTSRDLQIAQMENAARAASGAASSADERYRAELEKYYRGLGVGNEMDINKLYQYGSMAGSEGLLKLYGTSPAELARYDDNLLKAAGLYGENDLIRAGYMNQPKGVNWAGIANAGANVVGSWLDSRGRQPTTGLPPWTGPTGPQNPNT
jgi:hypothetical protein